MSLGTQFRDIKICSYDELVKMEREVWTCCADFGENMVLKFRRKLLKVLLMNTANGSTRARFVRIVRKLGCKIAKVWLMNV